MKTKSIVFLLSIFLFSSCLVPKKKLEEMENLKNQVQGVLKEKDKEIKKLQAQNAETQGKLKDCEASSSKLRQDSLSLAEENKKINGDFRNLKAECQQLNTNYQQLKSSSSARMQQMLADLESLQKDLNQREKRLAEVERALKERDSTMNALRLRVAKALLGFKDKGLTVEIKDGKVYVSLSNKLLFASGSTKIDKSGQEALKELARVLKEQDDIRIMVEGHTDNVPVGNLGDIKDNWDLSVMRSTAVVRLLVGEGVQTTRIIPSGRSEFIPKQTGDTDQARAANRRTEIIISPDLDVLYDLVK